MREEKVQLTNSSENLLIEKEKLTSQIGTWLSLTTILISRYFFSILFLTKYQRF